MMASGQWYGRRAGVVVSALVTLLLGTVGAAAQPPDVTVEYYHLDAVGSVRAVTDATGAVVRRYDYRPFGEGDGVSSGADPMRFTGKERDAETGLDYFGARYSASRTGRFTTVDPLMNTDAALTDPQRWNRYAYANNNPLRFFDPDGRDPVPTAWNTGRGADGLVRVLPAIAKELWNVVVSLNSPGHISSPEAQARRDGQFMQPANTEEAVIMGLTDVAMLASPLMGAGRVSSAERAGLTSTAELEATHGLTMSRTKFGDLKADIAKNGIREPIKYVEVNGQKLVVDGHHRLRAAQALGIRNVPTQEVRLPYAGYRTLDDLVNMDR